MKTDELISFLSTQVSWSTAGKPYHRHRRRSCRRGSNRPHALGIRSPHGCLRTHALDYLVLSLMFVAGIVIQGTIYRVRVVRLARPRGERRIRAAMLALRFIAIVLLGASALASTPRA